MIRGLRSRGAARARAGRRRRARRHRRAGRRARGRTPRDRRARPEPGDGRPGRRRGGRRARARGAARGAAGVPGGRAMKRIGLLGGMSWESTIEYYRLVNELVARAARRAAFGRLPAAQRRLRRHRGAPARGPLGRGGRSARARGAGSSRPPAPSCSCCARTRCTSSRRRSRPRSASRSSTSPTRPPTPSSAPGSTRVGLLATAYTMEQEFYVGRLREHGLEVVGPGRRRPQDRPRRDLRRAVPRRRRGRVARGVPADHALARRPTARRASCSAAPRSTCSSAPRTRRCRSSTPPACTPSGRSSSAWREAASPRPSTSPSPARPAPGRGMHGGDGHLGHERLAGEQPDPRPAADLGDRDDLGREVVLGRGRRARRRPSTISHG